MKQIFILIFSILSFVNLNGQTNTLYTVPGDNFLTIGDYSSTNGTKGILFTGFRDICPNYFGASIETVNSWVCCNGYPGSGYAGIKHIGLNFNIHDPSNFGANDKITAMSITSQGYIGIGTTSPTAKLDVIGKLHVASDIYGSKVLTFQDDARFEVSSNAIPSLSSSSFSMPQYGIATPSTTGAADLWLAGYNAIRMFTAGNVNPVVNILYSGNVGIGTQNPDQKLTVKGNIHAEEVIIDLAVPADYVFKPNYKLMPLHQVEQFVKANSHLPEIPSASEITKNGLSMGEMQNKLLQKVEELTLYAIEMKKEINALKDENKRIKTQLDRK